MHSFVQTYHCILRICGGIFKKLINSLYNGLIYVKKSHIMKLKEEIIVLIRFAVENFLSFKETTEFSMVAGKITRHSNHIAICNNKRILKSAFLFGANASGKTNLIRAVDFARDIVTQGLENTNCDKKFFRIDPNYKNKPSVFQNTS